MQMALRKEEGERLRLEREAAEERLRLKAQADKEHAQAEEERARAAAMQEQLLQVQEAARRLEQELQAERVSLCRLPSKRLQHSARLVT